jgi:MerR family gold-responsive transcriptional activator of gol and ges genes
MNIGDAAARSGVSAKMIRHYEETGLIPRAARSASGYRGYTEADVHMLRFIRRARDLGFSLTDIHELLELWRDRSRRSADVKRIALAHAGELRHRILQMQEMAATLEQLASCCAGDNRPECPILESLENPPEPPPANPPEKRGTMRARKALRIA